MEAGRLLRRNRIVRQQSKEVKVLDVQFELKRRTAAVALG